MKRFAMFFWCIRVWVDFGWGAVYILIWCSVCGVVWCGQVPRPHALRKLRYNPTRPPISYVTLSTCVCKQIFSRCFCLYPNTNIDARTQVGPEDSQRVKDHWAEGSSMRLGFFLYACWCLTWFRCAPVNAKVVSVETNIMLREHTLQAMV